jgi:RNA polymerase sigma-54 factor
MSQQGLYQSQSQKMAIGPQMQQSLQILQAPTLELRQIIQLELEVNPVLEVTTSDVSLEEALSHQVEDTGSDDFQGHDQLDEEWKEYWSQSRVDTPLRRTDDQERRQYMMDSIVMFTTLQDHLLAQLRTMNLEDKVLIDGVEFLIGSLNDHGFLQYRLEDICINQGFAYEKMLEAKEILIGFDPVGVGADDLRECLLIQMDRLGKQNCIAYSVIENHFQDLANKRYSIIARKIGVGIDLVFKSAELISTLDPRPASRFRQDGNHYVTADVIVENDDGRWHVSLNQDELPMLKISHLYKDMLGQVSNASDVRNYIREKIKSGKFLMRAVQQRQQTILKIATQIVKYQEAFLNHGSSQLKPLNMLTIAEEVGVHETTVSRAVSGKYILTPHGLFEMKYFFTHGVQTKSGEDVSNTTVKNSLSELIKNESKQKPLSDEKIVMILNEQGIKVARRTVAKYREALGLLPSHLRKTL